MHIVPNFNRLSALKVLLQSLNRVANLAFFAQKFGIFLDAFGIFGKKLATVWHFWRSGVWQPWFVKRAPRSFEAREARRRRRLRFRC